MNIVFGKLSLYLGVFQHQCSIRMSNNDRDRLMVHLLQFLHKGYDATKPAVDGKQIVLGDDGLSVSETRLRVWFNWG